jgi:hypothetical protein
VVTVFEIVAAAPATDKKMTPEGGTPLGSKALTPNRKIGQQCCLIEVKDS